MERKLHLLDTFWVEGSDGQAYKVCGYEHLVRDETLVNGFDRWEPTGVVEYRLAGGERVDVLPDGSMRIARSGVVLPANRKRSAPELCA